MDEFSLKCNFVSSDGISYVLQGMKDGKLDIAIGAITITKEREEIFDFGYSDFHSGLGIMILAAPEFSVVGFISSLLSKFS